MATTTLNRTQSSYFPLTSTLKEFSWQYGFKQVPRTNNPLPYRAYHTRCLSHNWDGSKFQPVAPSYQALCLDLLKGNDEASAAATRAVLKLREQLGPSGSLGTALVEIRSSFDMIADRASALWKGYKHLKRGRFRKFLSTFNLRPKQKHRNTVYTRPKDASSLWLEYWMGWAPTVGDIATAVEITQGMFPPIPITASSASDVIRTSRSQGSSGKTERAFGGKVIVKCGAEFQISNPNLYRANQLGFTNPALTLWEILPFSFLVDWFANIGNYLKEYTAYFGLNVLRPWTTTLVKGREVSSYGWSLDRPTWYTFDVQNRYAYMGRVLSLPSVKLAAGIPVGLSLTRAATAMSLLFSIFSKG